MIWLLVTILLATTFAEARGRERVFCFEGIAVKGDLGRFVRKLHKDGYLITGEYENEVYMVGTWRGNYGAGICARGGTLDGQVKGVTVTIEVSDEWKDIETAYDRVVESFLAEYGEPVESVFSFGEKDTRHPTERILRLIAGKADIHSAWNFKGGAILVSAEHSESGFHIIVKYLKNMQF